jgi:hypothetical protein
MSFRPDKVCRMAGKQRWEEAVKQLACSLHNPSNSSNPAIASIPDIALNPAIAVDPSSPIR